MNELFLAGVRKRSSLDVGKTHPRPVTIAVDTLTEILKSTLAGCGKHMAGDFVFQGSGNVHRDGRDATEGAALLADLRRTKRFAKATHHTWAAVLDGDPVKDDDGESGAGALILQMLERAGLQDHVVIVTRWYGGKHLGGDRFRHVVDAVRHYLRETGLG